MAEQNKKKVAVVTGASRGIGRAIALELASRGAAVVINYNGSEERAKEVQKAQKAIEAGECPLEVLEELKPVMAKIQEKYPEAGKGNIGVGSTIFAVKPGDGSAREQAASCQKVLGGWANIANEYATKRYRSNLINWGMLPFIIDKGELPFENGDYIFIPEIQDAIKNKVSTIKAFVVNKDMKEFELKLDELTDDERQIILDGCLINYYRENK